MPTESTKPVKFLNWSCKRFLPRKLVKAPVKKAKKFSLRPPRTPKPPAKKVSSLDARNLQSLQPKRFQSLRPPKKDEKIEKNGASRPAQGRKLFAHLGNIGDAHLEGKTESDYLFAKFIKQSENEHIPNCTARQQIWRWRAFNGFKGRIKCVTPKMPKIVLPKGFSQPKEGWTEVTWKASETAEEIS